MVCNKITTTKKIHVAHKDMHHTSNYPLKSLNPITQTEEMYFYKTQFNLIFYMVYIAFKTSIPLKNYIFRTDSKKVLKLLRMISF